MHLKIYTDGACWGNPGPAAIGAVIKDEQGRELASISQYIGRGTNNEAEYKAVIAALEAATRFKPDEVILYLDSELILRQLTGRYKIKSISLRPLFLKASSLLSGFPNLSFVHVRHHENIEAHTLAKAALDKLSRQGN